MTSSICISPVSTPVTGAIRPPGSKSITNRALILAALADGNTYLTGVLDSEDTRVMVDSLRRLGFDVQQDLRGCTCVVAGRGGRIPAESADLWLQNSGTSIRFLTALCALGTGKYRLDGIARMRQRPIGDLVRSLTALGAHISFEQPDSDCPPVLIDGICGRFTGGQASIAGNISSQFLSALLMSAPCAAAGVELTVDGELVSQPYVSMTLRMMEAFGIACESDPAFSHFRIPHQTLRACDYDIEPDASAASYFLAAAAMTRGEVTVEGLSRDALQGDVRFADALEQMGCTVTWQPRSVTVRGAALRGIEIDMNAISDTAQTLAVVATVASSPTTIRNVGHMRHKETDRISAVVTELNRCGIQARESGDGLTIVPGRPHPAAVHTYDDH
ncbi:MAG: 3-phosphoshikimate 1-carboxyvinyltransferase, partial [Planctomycetaceae bacterium]|nr:3-phosphoshikimate 1-carboxyvinyltransferase [Planctomycetaceae bacterium]